MSSRTSSTGSNTGPDEVAVARLLETRLGKVLKLAYEKRDRGLWIGDLFQEGVDRPAGLHPRLSGQW